MAFDETRGGSQDLDAVVIGAGLSGVCAAAYLAKDRPQDRFMVLEARETMGGTWSLFRYPGVRSDSDMFTLGYSFRPWADSARLADGPSIRAYVEETARDCGLEDRIAYRHKVVAADFSTEEARWRLTVETPDGVQTFRARFLFCCSGYYDYDKGYTPDFEGAETFRGDIIHPQHWPEGTDLKGKRVALIGSGATAVTLLPAMAGEGAHVTQIQRTPSYVVSLPGEDGIAAFLQRRAPARLAHRLARWKNILFAMGVYQLSRVAPKGMRRQITKAAIEELGGDEAAKKHFDPPYDPWDQRLCVAPDGDFFQAMREGRAEIVTGEIARITETGVDMKDGAHVEADLIVTATGLNLKLMGGMEVSVDGAPFSAADSLAYRGAMFSGAPNAVFTFGYINASWTLKCELIIAWAMRLLRYMDRIGADIVTPTPPKDVARDDLVALSSGYFQRGKALLPKQGDRSPWRAPQNYLRDLFGLRWARLRRGLVFSKRNTAGGEKTDGVPPAKTTEAA